MEQKVDILTEIVFKCDSNTKINELLNSNNYSNEAVDTLLNSDKITDAQKQTIQKWKAKRAGF